MVDEISVGINVGNGDENVLIEDEFEDFDAYFGDDGGGGERGWHDVNVHVVMSKKKCLS